MRESKGRRCNSPNLNNRRKTVCGNHQPYFAVEDNVRWKLSASPVMISACRQQRGRSISQLHVQSSQETEIPTFCLGAASKALPAKPMLSRAGSIASIWEEVGEQPGASCLMKQAAVVIKNLYSHTNLGMAPITVLFTHKRAIPSMWVSWRGSPDQAHPKSRSALET